jgi:hypothetical protein
VERAHDDFEGGLLGKFRVRVDRDAAAIVGDGEGAVGSKLHLDEGGMARQGLVHGIVDHLGKQVMERLLVGAADIHAGPPAHRLQTFQHLDVVGGVGVATAIARRFRTLRRRAGGGRLGEQVSGSRLLLCRGCGLGHAVPMRLMPAYRSASDGVGLSFSRAVS